MMDQKGIENFKKLVADFRALTTKVQKDNPNKKKSLKQTNLVLEAWKKEYQKLDLEHANLKKKRKKNTKSSKRNCLNTGTITEAVKQQTRLLRIERLNLAISSLTEKN